MMPPPIGFDAAQVKARGIPGEKNANAAFDSGSVIFAFF